MLLNFNESHAQNIMIKPWVLFWNTLYQNMSGQNILIVVVSDDDDKCEAEITLLLSNWMIAKVFYSQIYYSLVNEISVFMLFFDILIKTKKHFNLSFHNVMLVEGSYNESKSLSFIWGDHYKIK